MALDIEIDYGNKVSPYWLALEFNEFNILVNAIKRHNNLPLLQRCLSNYFGDSEVYLNELDDLKSEVINSIEQFNKVDLSTTVKFLNDFLKLIEIAIKQRKTIKLSGD